MSRLRISPDAARDLDEIWEYIALDDIHAADAFLGRLQKHIHLIGDSPGVGHFHRLYADEFPYLFAPMGRYVVVYRTVADTVEVLAVTRDRDIPMLLRIRGL